MTAAIDVDAFNDVHVAFDSETIALLWERSETAAAGVPGGHARVDLHLAQHVAKMMTTDPMVIYRETLDQVDDTRQTDHWENIQSTNWNSARLKPPPPSNGTHDPTSTIGWRVELRTPELQLTDFENAATAVVSQLLVRVILRDGLDLYMPISKIDENIARANSRNSIHPEILVPG